MTLSTGIKVKITPEAVLGLRWDWTADDVCLVTEIGVRFEECKLRNERTGQAGWFDLHEIQEYTP